MLDAAMLVVTGASGVGKTTAVRRLEARRRPGTNCFYFDDIGVPTDEMMQREFGSGEAWQADATRRWIARLAKETAAGSVSVLDGQTRPSFLRTALAEVQPIALRIVLMECSSEARNARLRARGDAELVAARMEPWSAYLRGQADALGLSVIDTTALTVEATADALEAEIEALRAAPERATLHPGG